MAYQYNPDDSSRLRQEETKTSGAARGTTAAAAPGGNNNNATNHGANTNSTQTGVEQAQLVLESAAGILDASSLMVGQSGEDQTSSFYNYSQEQQQQPVVSTARSNPIAIRRGDHNKKDEFSSSEEDEEEDLGRRTNRLMNLEESSSTSSSDRAAAQSLPSRFLLRAPHLGSVPTNNREEFLPAISLSEQQDDGTSNTAAAAADTNDTTVAYGSLRDSQLQGRFQDGPCSFYRDRRTGRMRQRSSSSKNVRFQMASSAPVQPQADGRLSIGERIQLSRKMQKAQNNSNQQQRPNSQSSLLSTVTASTSSSNEPTSSLAAMLEASSTDDVPKDSNGSNTSAGQRRTAAAPSMMMEETAGSRSRGSGISSLLDRDDDNDVGMLSTSLTGLEVLQRGLRAKGDNDEPGSRVQDAKYAAAAAARRVPVVTLSFGIAAASMGRSINQQQQLTTVGLSPTSGG